MVDGGKRAAYWLDRKPELRNARCPFGCDGVLWLGVSACDGILSTANYRCHVCNVHFSVTNTSYIPKGVSSGHQRQS